MGDLLIIATACILTAIATALLVRRSWIKDRRRLMEQYKRPELPEGVAAVLAVLRMAAVVVDVADGVVKASPASYAFGLVRAGRLVHDPLVEIIRQVRQDGVIRERDLDLPRGPLGPGRLIMHVRVAPLGPLHVILLAEDRTEAQRLEAVRRDFVVNISHELKTPVGAISLLSETLIDAAEDPETVRRFASRMQIESTRLTQLVKEVIDLSRLQVNQGIEQPERVQVDDVVAEAVDRSKLTAENRQVELNVGQDSGAIVFGERELLVTAVRNLVDNAIRYSDPRTKVGIGVRTEAGIVEIAVADQGLGLAPEDLDRVFERFYRVDAARSRETGGTGLGLSIVKHVAANHGGDVNVWSRLGEGSTFTLRLPAASAEERNDRLSSEGTQPGASHHSDT